MVQQGLGLAMVNPLTALAMAGSGLVVRRLGFSVPFSINALLPLVPPSLARSAAAGASPLKAQAQEVTAALQRLLSQPAN